MPLFEHNYADQLDGFYTALPPTQIKGARLLYHRASLARELGLDETLFDDAYREFWYSETFFPGMLPLAQVYSGHQFGQWAGHLGYGRAVLRSVIREFLASEALHHLSIPTTRALTIVTSDQPVFRKQPERGAMLMRIAESHIRFGHFEHFYYRKQPEQVKMLADYFIAHHWPQLSENEPVAASRYQKWFSDVVKRTAEKWLPSGKALGSRTA